MSTARLAWVFVDGTLHHVSKFAHLPPGQRPHTRCPVCNQLVVLKLGRKVTHHCAHHPERKCPSIAPETAAHLNAKFRLYQELQNANTLKLKTICTDCKGYAITTWLKDWDRVEVEFSVGSRRPDVALLKEDQVIGAIEVHVTHAVDEVKAAYYTKHNIPWVEVEATSILHAKSTWSASMPLIPSTPKVIPPHLLVRCDECWVRYRKRNEDVRMRDRCIRIVDLRHPGGETQSVLFRVVEIVREGEVVELSLWCGDEVVGVERSPVTKASTQRLTQVYRGLVGNWRTRGIEVKSRTGWSCA